MSASDDLCPAWTGFLLLTHNGILPHLLFHFHFLTLSPLGVVELFAVLNTISIMLSLSEMLTSLIPAYLIRSTSSRLHPRGILLPYWLLTLTEAEVLLLALSRLAFSSWRSTESIWRRPCWFRAERAANPAAALNSGRGVVNDDSSRLIWLGGFMAGGRWFVTAVAWEDNANKDMACCNFICCWKLICDTMEAWRYWACLFRRSCRI